MFKINVEDVPWIEYRSPGTKFAGKYKEVSVALGAAKDRNQYNGGHPFDLAIEQLAPGETLSPFHDHAAQWELFYILTGTATVRAGEASYAVGAGDVMMHPPGEAHQIVNTGEADLTYILIADNPQLEVCRYPDSNKTGIFDSDGRRELFRPATVDYFDGEE